MSVETDFPRVRLAKREIARALEAVEKCDAEGLETGIRVLQLEDDLAYARELASRWRCSYEAVQGILAATDPQGRATALDKALRDFVGKA